MIMMWLMRQTAHLLQNIFVLIVLVVLRLRVSQIALLLVLLVIALEVALRRVVQVYKLLLIHLRRAHHRGGRHRVLIHNENEVSIYNSCCFYYSPDVECGGIFALLH